MAAVAAVAFALFRSGWRGLRGAGSFTGNNLVALIALLMWEEPQDRPSSTAVIYLMVGLLWTFPMSQELTRRIPPVRFRLWPLGGGQKAAIHFVNLALNPLFAIAILFSALSRHPAVGMGLLCAAIAGPFVALGSRKVRWSPVGWIPRFPGRFGGLMQSHVRELLQLLDFHLALLTAIGGLIYCWLSAHPDPEASVVLGTIVVLLMSTCAQGQTSFDAVASEQRMRMLPISRTTTLFVKDAAWMTIVIPLFIGFQPVECFAAALAALAVGHRVSAGRMIEQRRWNFATGKLVPEGVVQIVMIVSAAAATHNTGAAAIVIAGVGYAGSLWWYGRQ